MGEKKSPILFLAKPGRGLSFSAFFFPSPLQNQVSWVSLFQWPTRPSVHTITSHIPDRGPSPPGQEASCWFSRGLQERSARQPCWGDTSLYRRDRVAEEQAFGDFWGTRQKSRLCAHERTLLPRPEQAFGGYSEFYFLSQTLLFCPQRELI